MKTLVCLLTKNEKESIKQMIDQIKSLGFDLIVSDENSTDGTIDIARREGIAVYQRDGCGKGWGIRKAQEVAQAGNYDVLVLIDSDCTYHPKFIPELLKFFPEYDMVVGKRDMANIQFSHRIVNVIHTGLINLLFKANLLDINSGLRTIRLDKFRNLLDAQGFDIEAQMTTRALKNKFKIKEISIDYRKRSGKSKIRPWDTFTIIKRITKERFYNLI